MGTPRIEAIPMIAYHEIGKLKRGPCYDSIANNILRSQALLACFEPDADNIVTLAAGCTKAMKECLEVIFSAMKNKPPIKLHHLPCIYHMLIADKNVGGGCARPKAVARVRVPRYSAAGSNGDARFIQAIISLTRYTYSDLMNRGSGGIWTMCLWRTLGHCGRKDAVHHLGSSFMSWMINNRSRLSIRRVQKDVVEPEAPSGRIERFKEFWEEKRSCIEFGLSFSHAFDIELSSAKNQKTLDVDSDMDEQR